MRLDRISGRTILEDGKGGLAYLTAFSEGSRRVCFGMDARKDLSRRPRYGWWVDVLARSGREVNGVYRVQGVVLLTVSLLVC